MIFFLYLPNLEQVLHNQLPINPPGWEHSKGH